MIRLNDPDSLEITRRFLHGMCSLNAQLSSAQALVEAIRQAGRARRVELTLRESDEDPRRADQIIWDAEGMPLLTATTAELRHGAGALHVEEEAAGTHVALRVYAARADWLAGAETELRTLVRFLASAQRVEIESARSTERRYMLPVTFREDLAYIQEHIARSYCRFRDVAAAVLATPALSRRQPYAFFLLYDPSNTALTYPITDFYELTPAGFKNIERHLTHLGSDWSRLGMGDTSLARRLLLEIFCEALNLATLEVGNGKPLYAVRPDGSRMALLDSSLTDGFAWIADFIAEHITTDEGPEAPLSQWRHGVDTHPCGDERAAANLLSAVLRALPQGMSAGFATRCFLTGTSHLFLNSRARREWRTPSVPPAEWLTYELIVAIERHFFRGSFCKNAGWSSELDLGDDGETAVAMAPMVARGQPIGVFFVIEPLTEQDGAERDAICTAAQFFCEHNAAAVAELVQDSRELDFVRRCRANLQSVGASLSPVDQFETAILSELNVFLNVVPGTVKVRRSPEDELREIKTAPEGQLRKESAAAIPRHLTLRRVPVYLSQLCLRGYGRCIDVAFLAECTMDGAERHRYEWLSTISSAYSHALTFETGAKWAYPAAAMLLRHAEASHIHNGLAIELRDIAKRLESTAASPDDVEKLRGIEWVCAKLGHQATAHPRGGNGFVRSSNTDLDVLVREARDAAARVLALRFGPEEAQWARGSSWLRTLKLSCAEDRIVVRGCAHCLQYALVEVLLNAVKGLFTAAVNAQPPVDRAVLCAFADQTDRHVRITVENWLPVAVSSERERLGALQNFLSENPVPAGSEDGFDTWRDRCLRILGKTGTGHSGLVEEVARTISNHAGALQFELGPDLARLTMAIPR